MRSARAALAFDRVSSRTIDRDGRLHLQSVNISKAAVNGYRGSEIPECEVLGLNPDRVYQIWRDPAELAKAAASFNRLPVLNEHIPVHAQDHQPSAVVGATGSSTAFRDPYLQTEMVIWASPAIMAIDSGEQRELSSAYRYTAIMEPGSYQGVRYDGRMAGICGSHVALVREGRAGPDCVVGDSNLHGTPMQRLVFEFPNMNRLKL